MSLVALTTYYNPLRGIQRRINYQTFRRHLGIPLITVEWAPTRSFELSGQDAEHLIQVAGGDLLWQKERLLNIGIEHARIMGIDKVAILDSDIVFEATNWYEAVSEKLEGLDFIQCFDIAHYLPSCEHQHLSVQQLFSLQAEYTAQALFGSIARGDSLYHSGEEALLNEAGIKLRGNPGLATAVNLKRLSQWRHYEGNIVGGGDLAMVAALSGKTQELFSTLNYTTLHQYDLIQWAEAQNAFGVRIGNIPGRILHLWHGEIADRQYRQRYSILTRYHYNPATDVAIHDRGALRFNYTNTNLQQAVGDYILSRKDA